MKKNTEMKRLENNYNYNPMDDKYSKHEYKDNKDNCIRGPHEGSSISSVEYCDDKHEAEKICMS